MQDLTQELVPKVGGLGQLLGQEAPSRGLCSASHVSGSAEAEDYRRVEEVSCSVQPLLSKQSREQRWRSQGRDGQISSFSIARWVPEEATAIHKGP